ncbi:MAG: alpha-L-rhamnosidase, partial [Cyclobacteriaceae bacterium]|nr:alpha-L-rhamnosidase [Cyclobacteriaceae bacterium]
TSGSPVRIISDDSWECDIAGAWKPGQYKRWYLRSFQEEFDNRLYPDQWSSAAFTPSSSWRKVMVLNNASDLPALCSDYPEYMLEIQGQPENCELRERIIPPILEKDILTGKLSEKKQLRWIHSPETYFQMVTPGAYEVKGELEVTSEGENEWSFTGGLDSAALLTFEFDEQMVGFPFFSIKAQAGTVVELLVQEGHQINTDDPLMNNHFHSWTRFICKNGINHFRTFDFESLRWMQIHIHNTEGPVVVSKPGIKRRRYDWPNQPEILLGDERVQKVINASVNTIHNAAQETIVDGMGRERQQYSGDVGHQLHAIFYTFGEYRLPARYLNTFSQGLTYDGYFLDSWPAYDRLARLMERQLDLTRWGPILDHSIGFNFDSYYYYLYTGDLDVLREVYPRLLVFKNYLKKIINEDDGLLPVENIGIPYVWIDHNAYKEQKHKQCAYNLYASAMLSHALAPLCDALKDDVNQKDALKLSSTILEAVMDRFYSRNEQSLVINKPWLSGEPGPRYCDRSLATAILFDQLPSASVGNALNMLADKPASMGLSYPANAGWRYWALAKGNRMDVVINELRNIWAAMPSVNLNNTLQENWDVHPDSGSQWSHCPVAPLYLIYMGLLGLHPLSPGFGKIKIKPQLGDLSSARIVAQTVQGPVHFESQGITGNRKIIIHLPVKMTGYLELDPREKVRLGEVENSDPSFKKYQIDGGQEINLKLKYT